MLKWIIASLLAFAGYAQAESMLFDCPGGTLVLTTGKTTCVGAATTPPPGGGGTTPPPVTDFDGCPADAVKSKTFYPVKTPPASTSNIGLVGGGGKFLSIRMQVPSTAPQAGYVEMFFSGVYGGAPRGVWAISEKACDVDSPIVDPKNSKPDKVPPKIAYMKGHLTPNISTFYSYGGAGTGGVTKTMEIGRTYYLNIQIDTCIAAGGCWFDNVKMP